MTHSFAGTALIATFVSNNSFYLRQLADYLLSSAPHQIDQSQLVSRLLARDKQALSYLYDHYSGALYGMISRIVTDQDVAEEVLQDAFLKIWDRINQFDAEKGRLFTWMANLCRNLAIDRLRSREMKKAGKTDTLETYVSTTDTITINQQEIDGIGLREQLKNLREEERLLLDLVYFKGYTQSEIVKEYDIPLGTVKTRLRMAMKNLRTILKIT